MKNTCTIHNNIFEIFRNRFFLQSLHRGRANLCIIPILVHAVPKRALGIDFKRDVHTDPLH